MTEADLNGLWAAMGEADKTALARDAVLIHLPKDDVLLQRGDIVERVYLPITADISNVVQMSDGSMAMATYRKTSWVARTPVNDDPVTATLLKGA